MSIYDNCEEHKSFRVSNGNVIRNLQDLAQNLEQMDTETFQDHVTEEKHDFSSWVKDVLGEIDNALDKVKELRGVYFTENETAKSLGYNNDKRQVGVIAQEVQKVLPEVVTEAPIDDKYITVWYDKLFPLLIEAIKELSAKVDKLEGK